MFLNLSYLAARERSTGNVEMLAFAASIAGGGVGNAEVGKSYHRFLAPEGVDLRAKYSHILFVIDNNVRSNHEFPDPGIAEREHLRQQIKAAEAELARALSAADQAKGLAKTAKELAGQAEKHGDRIRELKEKHGAVTLLPSAPFVTADAPKTIPLAPKPKENLGPREVLTALGDAGLAAVAKTYDVPSDGVSREDLISAILKKAGYKLAES